LRRYCREVVDDLILPDGRGGLAQIDHLVLTSAGLLVVETKNYGGLIFGETRDRTWTQCIGRQRNRLQNPLRQNYGHIKAVQALSTGVPVTGLVVFTNRARFPKGQPDGVTTIAALPRALVPLAGATISADYRSAWSTILAQARTDREARRAHLDGVRHCRE
jgi:hypothetical protein